jgi:uncharacterized protein YbaR (Trm112 family)
MSTNDKSKAEDIQPGYSANPLVNRLINEQGKGQKINEVKDYHPLVAKWLVLNGYTYQHHYKLDDYGIVDFLATHEDGHKLLVEAKCVRSKIKEAILQVRVYQSQMPEAKAVVVTAPEFLREKDFPMADKYGVKIVTVELSEEFRARANAKPIKITICPGCRQPLYYHKDASSGMVSLTAVGDEIANESNIRIDLVSADEVSRVAFAAQKRLVGKSKG